MNQNNLKAPELLAPAGSYRKLDFATAYGADAVYVGVPLFSLRARENEVNLEELKKGIDLVHAQNKKVYVTANIFARNRKIQAFGEHLKEWVALKPDALIMSDPGLMLMVREKYPEIPIHLSVQANCMNWQSVRFWHKSFGVERVILSRELNLNEIREIKQRVPEIELEAFVHGAICIAYSGRCLMSSYFSHRDANQGVCDNSCRERFKIYEAPKEKVESNYYLEDMRNQGEFYQIDESEDGTLLMNAKDLRMIEYIKEITEAGVCSLKVEGRSKSEYYVSLVTRAYRKAIDDMMAGKNFDLKLFDELNKISNRGYHTGFMIHDPGPQAQNYETGSRATTNRFAGLVLAEDLAKSGYLPVEVRNQIRVGDRIELMIPHQESDFFTVTEILNPKGQSVEVAHGGTGAFLFKYHGPYVSHGVLSVVIPFASTEEVIGKSLEQKSKLDAIQI